jgi:serpin B
MRTEILTSTLVAISLAVACGGDTAGPSPDPDFEQAKSEKQRLPASAAHDAVTTLTGNNTDFAFDLLRASEPEGNFFYSPHSISIALAMTYAGAAGQTKSEMQQTLHFDQADADLHGAFNTLDQKLASRGQNAKGADGQPFRLRVSNAAWAERDYSFLPSYLDVLAENYGAGIHLLDFIEAPEPSRIVINDWVSDQTEGRIPELLPQGAIDSDTRLVLTNTVYFNASWANPFEPAATADGGFTRLDGSSATVSYMRQTASHRYGAGSGYEAVEIQYDGAEVSMLIVLPDAGTFAQFEQTLSQAKLGEVLSGLSAGYDVKLGLPKFELRTRAGLAGTLSQMGMPTAFSPAADFSAMNGSGGLMIQDVVHEAFVKLNEAGTEAAAATAVTVGVTSIPEIKEVDVDRPFLFVIRDNETGASLFIGRITDPSAES